MTLGDVPEFHQPTEDVSRVVKSSEYMTLTVEVTGTPRPRCNGRSAGMAA